MSVRPVAPADAEAWARMRAALWPGWPEDHPPEIAAFFDAVPEDAACFLAEAEDGAPLGFAEVARRRSAEGCGTSPVGYLEGIWVEPRARRAGVARALVSACEAWARERGCTELGSDRAPENDASRAFHEAVGFEEVGTIVCYRKEI